MEEEYPSTQPCISTDLDDYPFISQLGYLIFLLNFGLLTFIHSSNLQQNFNEKYMSKFFSELKVKETFFAIGN